MEGNIEWQRAGPFDWLIMHPDRPLQTERNEIPSPSTPLKPTGFFSNVTIGQSHLTIRGTADSH